MTARKHYFRVADKVLRKGWSNDELSSLVRLMAYLNGRWAREGVPSDEAGYAEISVLDLMTITGKRRADIARKSAERWRDIAEMSVQHRGEVTVILWPKYPVFQGMTDRPRARNQSPPQPPPHTHTQEEEESRASRAPRHRQRGRKNGAARKPKALPAAWALDASALLGELLEPVPGAQFPRGWRERWAAEIERLVRETPELKADPDPPAKIEAAIRWALGPENLGREYEVQIRSGRSLREKWPKLVAAARRARRSDPIDPEALARRVLDA